MDNSLQIKYLLVLKNKAFIYYVFEHFFNSNPSSEELKGYQKKVNSVSKRLTILKELVDSSNCLNVNIKAFEKISKKRSKYPFLYGIYLFVSKKQIIRKILRANPKIKINLDDLSEPEKYIYLELQKHLKRNTNFN